MIVGWAILPSLSKFNGWAPGPVGDMTTGARGWILRTALAIMISDSTISLIPVFNEFISKVLRTFKKKEVQIKLPRTPLSPERGEPVCSEDEYAAKDDKDFEPSERLVPNKWLWSGLFVSLIIGILLVWAVFGAEGIKPWATIIGFLMGGLLSLLGYAALFAFDQSFNNLCMNRVLALGETDLNPVSGLGKISQPLFTFVRPGNVVANIIAGGVAEAGAQQWVHS